jgi:hypothetical protein
VISEKRNRLSPDIAHDLIFLRESLPTIVRFEAAFRRMKKITKESPDALPDDEEDVVEIITSTAV